MRKNIGAHEYLYPMPVLVVASFDEKGVSDAMVAAWGGISDTKEIGLCLDKSHKTVKNILQKKAFTVSPATANQMVACDYVGLVSANDVSGKIEKAGWHVTKSQKVDAPLIEELPLSLECELISYDNDSGHLLAKIVDISVDESVLSGGEIDVQKLQPITFDAVHHKYIKLGDVVGNAFGEGKKFL